MSQTQPTPIVAYFYKRMWYSAKEVETKRASDPTAFVNAHPYTLAEIRRRKKYGGEVPEWIDLDEQDTLDDQKG